MTIELMKNEYETLCELEDVLSDFIKNFPAAKEQLEGERNTVKALCLRYEDANLKCNE